jgi:flagellar motor switch protein FliM
MTPAEVLDRFGDLTFPLEIDFGGLEISVREVLELNIGSVLRTSQSARAPLTLRAGEAPIAAAEAQASGELLSARIQFLLEAGADSGKGKSPA